VTSTETGQGIEAKSPEIYELVEEGSAVEQVATGFTFTEGPIWHPDGYLLFSDMPGDVRRKYTPGGRVEEAMRPAFKCNGMTLDANLDLLVCEHVTSALWRERPDGSRELLAYHYEGKYLNSPNDVCVRSDGTIYFSDPWYGRMPGFGIERERELGWQGVFRIPPGGGPDNVELILDKDEFDQPNGLCFSPDESILYVTDSGANHEPGSFEPSRPHHIKAFDVLDGGRLAGERVFADVEPGFPDGIKVDTDGRVYASSFSGVQVFSPDGRLIGEIELPGAVNFCFGGPDRNVLFITADTAIYAAHLQAKGP
jgi:gluconolactonase